MQCQQCNIALPPDARFCAGCGQSIPGAPGPAAAPMSSKWVWVLVIGVGAVFVLMTAGIIAAIAIPNLLNAIDRGKQKRTMADLRSVAAAVETYSVDHAAYPVADDILSIRQHLEPRYIRTMPMVDGWGHQFHVSSRATAYSLASPGKDGVLQGCPGGPTSQFEADICFADGEFSQWPEGVQQ